jgi:hypothetical protein
MLPQYGRDETRNRGNAAIPRVNPPHHMARKIAEMPKQPIPASLTME